MSGAAAFRQVLLLLCLTFAALTPALADGPHIALHATQGAYEITLFTAPDPLVTGPVQMTLLVQNPETGALLPHVSARGDLKTAAGARVPLTLTLGGSSNAQLVGQTVKLMAPGSYTLRLEVSAAGGAAQVFRGELPVDTNRGKRNTVLWAVFLALAMVGLFLANQTAKQRLRVSRSRAG